MRVRLNNPSTWKHLSLHTTKHTAFWRKCELVSSQVMVGDGKTPAWCMSVCCVVGVGDWHETTIPSIYLVQCFWIESGLHVITYISRDVTGWQPDLDALNSKQPYFSPRRQLAASIKTYQIIQKILVRLPLSSRNPLGSLLSFLNFWFMISFLSCIYMAIHNLSMILELWSIPRHNAVWGTASLAA